MVIINESILRIERGSRIENLAVSSLGLMAERIQIRKQNPASWRSMNGHPYQDSIMF